MFLYQFVYIYIYIINPQIVLAQLILEVNYSTSFGGAFYLHDISAGDPQYAHSGLDYNW